MGSTARIAGATESGTIPSRGGVRAKETTCEIPAPRRPPSASTATSVRTWPAFRFRSSTSRLSVAIAICSGGTTGPGALEPSCYMSAAERQMCNPGVAPPVSGVSFDVIADTYDATRGLPPPLRETAVRAVADAMGRDGLGLEVGVGTGRFAIPPRSLGVRVVGVDIAPRMLANARGKGCGDLFLASALRLPFRHGGGRESKRVNP